MKHDELSEQRLREQTQAQEAQQRLLTAIEALPNLFALYDADERLLLCNQAYQTFYDIKELQPGIRYSEFLRALLNNGHVFEAREQAARWYRQRMRLFRKPEALFEAQYKENQWLEIRQQRTPEGGIIIIATDVSSRKLAEQERQRKDDALLEQSDLLRTVLEHQQEGVTVLDRQGCLLAWNRRYLEIMRTPEDLLRVGMSIDEILQYSISKGLMGPGNQAVQLAVWRQRVNDVEPYRLLVQPDGRSIEIRRVLTHTNRIVTTYSDVTRFKQAEQRIRETEYSFHALLESSHHGCFVQRNWQLLYANKAFATMLKYDSQDDLMAIDSLDEFIAPAHITRLWGYAEQRKRHGNAPREYEYEAVCKDGTLIPLQQAVSLINWEGETAFFCSVVDMTTHKQTERKLIEARLHTEQIARMKSEFLANTSHEIRTPLHGILGTVELLRQTDLKQQQQQYADVIARSGETLLCLIDDILDLSKIEAGKLQIIPAPFDLKQLLQDCQALFVENAARKGLGFHLLWENNDRIPKQLNGDIQRLRQVVLNLLSNAIKFTDQGEVSCSVQEVRRDKQRIWYRIAVKDSGVGIDKVKLPQLFDHFSQLDSSATRRYGGTGLGLAICKELVHLMGGEIGVDSTLGQGSEFWFELPLGLSTASAQRPPNAAEQIEAKARISATGATGRRLKILVAEDNPVNQELVKAMLSNLRHTYQIAENGEQVLQLLQQQSFDVIMMDCQMPQMDGFAATRAVRRREAAQQSTKPVPIIAMTASAFKDDQEQCLAAGMNDFLAKPFSQTSLEQIIQFWAKWTETSAQNPMTRTKKNNAIAVPAFDPKPLEQMHAKHQDELLKRLIQIFDEQSTLQRQQIQAAANRSDSQQLGDTAHSLKSASAQLGLRQLAALCEQLETAALQGQIDSAAVARLAGLCDAGCEYLRACFSDLNEQFKIPEE